MANKPRSAEIHPGPGFRVKVGFQRPCAEMVKEFSQFPTPDISDLLNRLYAVDPEIKLMTDPKHKICGPALTVKVFPGDNLMVHKAIDIIEPGDVVIVDAGSSRGNAVLGDLVSSKAKHRGAAGFVVDGLVRDLPTINEIDFPVFARGTTPIGPLHRGPGELNFPIACGGIVVNPGDIVVGDAAGVVVIPIAIAEELLTRLKSHSAANEAYYESVRKGNFSNAWVDQLLGNLECPLIKGVTVEPESPAPATR